MVEMAAAEYEYLDIVIQSYRLALHNYVGSREAFGIPGQVSYQLFKLELLLVPFISYEMPSVVFDFRTSSILNYATSLLIGSRNGHSSGISEIG